MSTSTETSSSPDTAPTESTATSSGEEPTSLDEYLGTAANLVRGGGARGGGIPARGTFDQDQVFEEQRLVQQEIQICMQAQGFEYSPEEVGDGLRFFFAGENSALSAAEYAETEGFGIATRFDALFEGDFDFSENASPNDEHLATLSEGAADAWQLALRGVPPVRNDAGELVDAETGEPVQGRGAAGGCTAEAQTIVRGDVTALADLADEFVELEERISADPRVAEIAREWIDCMNAEGFDYQDEAEARADITSELRPLLVSFFQASQVAGGDNDGGNGNGGGRGAGGGNRLQAVAGLELTPEQDAELDALQDRERAVAVASLSCQADTGEEIETIRQAYEAEFVTANRAALEAFAS